MRALCGLIFLCVLPAAAAECRRFEKEMKAHGRRVTVDDPGEFWTREVAAREWQLAIFNRTQRVISSDVIWKETGLPIQRGSSPKVRDLLRNEDRGKVHGGFAERIEPKSCAVFAVTP